MPDQDGYPPADELERVRAWPIAKAPTFTQSCAELLTFVRSLWAYENWGWHEKDGVYHVSTGGWSGNEDLADALLNNQMFRAFCWRLSRAGGHYIFVLPGKRLSESDAQEAEALALQGDLP